MPLTIRNVSGGVPSASASSSLYTTIITLSSIPTFDTDKPSVGHTLVDVSAANLSVTAGEQYAIALSRTAPSSAPWVLWRGGGVNLYSGGNWAVQATDGNPWGMPFGNYDLGFQTYVNTAAIPEPSALWLALAGAPALILARRRAG